MAERTKITRQETIEYSGSRYNGELTLSTGMRPAIKIREYAGSGQMRTIGKVIYETHIDAFELRDLIQMLQLMVMQLDLEPEK